MSPKFLRRVPLIAACFVLAASTPLVGFLPLAQAGFDTGSGPAPDAWGADTIGVLAAPGEVLDYVAIVWDEMVDPGFIPDGSDSKVRVNDGAPVDAANASLVYSGFASENVFFGTVGGISIMRIGLDFEWTADVDNLTLTYIPGARPVRDFALNDAPRFDELAVVPWDFVDFGVIDPIVDERHGRDRILLGVTHPIEPASLPVPGDFVVHGPSGEIGVETVTQIHDDMGMTILTLKLDARIEDPAATVTLEYVRPTDRMRSARTGAQLDAFAAPGRDVWLFLSRDSTTDTVVGGGSVGTTTPDGPTPADPVATEITLPLNGGGEVSVDEGPVTSTPDAGYAFFGQQVQITAPDAAPDAPLVLRFDIDATLIPVGQDATTIGIFRNGELAADCTGPAGWAVPSPCVSDRTTLFDGDVSITVLTAQASVWNTAIVIPFEFGGFLSPVDGDIANRATGGSAIPVKFSLGGDRGQDIFAAGSPTVLSVSCDGLGPSDQIEETVTAGNSRLTYDATDDVYTYVWRTDRNWRETCRKLVLDFRDGSRSVATFDFRR